MPLSNPVKNQITGQIDALFDAIIAGTAWTNDEWIHQSFVFTAGGREYIVVVTPEGNDAYASVRVIIKRRPV
jgi:hypothetical protein